jgi:hypothetical protein
MRVLFNVVAGISVAILFIALLGIAIGSFFPIRMKGRPREVELNSETFVYGWRFPPPATVASARAFMEKYETFPRFEDVVVFYRETHEYPDVRGGTVCGVIREGFRFRLWFFAFFSTILPTIWAVRFELKRQERRKRYLVGKCVTCEYDLRAHSKGQRCPECGTVIP